MKKWTAIGVALVVVLASACTKTVVVHDAVASPTASVSPVSPAPTPDEPVVKDGKFEVASCDWNGQDGANSKLIGSVRVKNTGNVAIDVRIEFAWLYGDGTKNEATPRTVTVGVGQSKLVFFTIYASQADIEGLQSHPDYMGGTPCKATANIIGGSSGTGTTEGTSGWTSDEAEQAAVLVANGIKHSYPLATRMEAARCAVSEFEKFYPTFAEWQAKSTFAPDGSPDSLDDMSRDMGAVGNCETQAGI